jgi:hypothetical protein
LGRIKALCPHKITFNQSKVGKIAALSPSCDPLLVKHAVRKTLELAVGEVEVAKLDLE